MVQSCDLCELIVFFCWSLQAALKQLATNKVPNMAVLLKSIVHTYADARAVFKDPTGFRLAPTPHILKSMRLHVFKLVRRQVIRDYSE